MSVVSERTFHSRRRSSAFRQPYRPGLSSNRSVIGGGMDIDQHYLLPQFSAAASEGTPRIDMRDDNWGDNTTVITGNTSDHSYNGLPERPMYPETQSLPKAAVRRCSRLCWLCSAFFISFLSIISAPLMAFIPLIAAHFNFLDYPTSVLVCEVDCQGKLLNMCGIIALLLLSLYVLYWCRSPADMPRLFLHRAAFAFFVFFILFAFWLFYIVRIVLERTQNYTYIISYAISLVDLLLIIHVIWIFFELRQFKPIYTVTITRDPDGESHTHEIGQMSIQEAAVYVLRFYDTYFQMYNPHLDRIRRSVALAARGFGRFRSRSGNPLQLGTSVPGFTLYDIDGRGDGTTLTEANVKALVAAAARRRAEGQNNNLLEYELDWERRNKKRACRLVSCAEEVFAQVKMTSNNQTTYNRVEPMDPSGAAKAMLIGISRPMNRYLKFTRQQSFFSPNQISDHLQRCLSYGFSAPTFLQRFFSRRIPPRDVVNESKWSILCDDQTSSPLRHGTSFVLRSHNTEETEQGVQLYCIFEAFPFYNITEQSIPQKSKFELKIDMGV